MAHDGRCPICEHPLPAGPLGDLCPRCLMGLGLFHHDDAADLGPATSGAPETRVGGVRLIEPIARGGMGEVFRGLDDRIGREVAVKMVRGDHDDRLDLARRFVDEARIAGRLQHPGIIPVYQLGEADDGRPYIVMRLVAGDTLGSALSRRDDPSRDLPRLLNVFVQICQAVAYAHSRGVIHRDLKPSNVMLGRFGEVQVMDWGLAKVVSDAGAEAGSRDGDRSGLDDPRAFGGASISGAVLGTPAYMAPQQARGEPATDARVDVFSLGSILCEVLTGRPAHEGETPAEVLERAASGDVRDAVERLRRCGAGEELAAIGIDCLSEDPERRPADAGAVAARVVSYLESSEQRSRDAELARAAAEAKAATERSRRRLTAALAAAVLAAVALGVAVVDLRERGRRQRLAAAESAIQEAETLARGAASDPSGDPARWESARDAARRARSLLDLDLDRRAPKRLDDLAGSIDVGFACAERDRRILLRLGDLRADEYWTTPAWLDAQYPLAFREAGLDPDAPRDGRSIRRPRDVARSFADALDDWAVVRVRLAEQAGRDTEAAHRVLDLASAVDPDPWRNELRRAIRDGDAAKLERIAGDAGLEARGPGDLCVLAQSFVFLTKQPVQALKILRRAQRAHPGDYWINIRLARHLFTYSSPGGRGEAVPYATAAAALGPRYAGPHLLLGEYAYVADGDPAAAEAAYRRAIDLRPDFYYAHFLLGVALGDQGRFLEAEASLRESIRLNPDCGDCRGFLGRQFWEQGRIDAAIDAMREAVDLDPTWPFAFDTLRIALTRLGRLEEAEAAGRRAVQAAPTSAAMHEGLGCVLAALDPASAEAEAEFRAALAIEASRPESRKGLVLAFLARGDEQEASRLAREFGSSPDLSRHFALAGRVPGAAVGIDRPTDPDEASDLADACRNRGAFAAAADVLSTALAAGPPADEFKVRLLRRQAAQCAARAGRNRQALGWLEAELAAIRSRPDEGETDFFRDALMELRF